MRILLVTQYFWPESFIINDMVRTLVSQGHTVKVLTGKPNYPGGEVFDGYTEAGSQDELFDGKTSVFRVPLRPRKAGGAKNLFFNYWSFIWNGLMLFPREVKNEHYDVIIVFAPSPLLSAIPAVFLRWKLKIHLAIWVQDLWPESLSATGFIKNRFLLALVRLLVCGIYSKADTLLVQSKGFIRPVSRYADAEKIVYYPNSYKEESFSLGQEHAQLKDKTLPESLANLLDQFFCVTFTGNLGTAQSLGTIIDVAAKLKYLPNLRIVLVGSGSLSDWLLEQKVNRKLDNLVLAGRFPPEMMPEIFMRSKVLLVTLIKEEIFSYTVPSKIQAYLSSGRPIIAALDGEGARVVETAKAGLTCGAEDVFGLAACIEQMVEMPAVERENFGLAGRKYFQEHFEMNSQCENLVRILEQRISKEKVI
ncbi:MAG: glycosyltransferase family 4 protein [Cycloclasticus sp.]|uniref:glycosyltransferase family 4 protein n=1 Tax=Cycloclasticus sp. TaxID=2024830 RepID=UPI00258001D3|nr:glycosyltransferase family 4 protein [Cycloclasticus sp.]MBV1899523.1 glycosyltransferase family 4 protein [Cycloclasticus sp.]